MTPPSTTPPPLSAPCTIYVDSDACPVKDEVVRVGLRHNLPICFVSNSWMRLADHPLISRIIVAEGPDEADNWIVDHIIEHDILITSDIPLASRGMEKGARALRPTGKLFTGDNIGMALAMRDLNAQLRESGDIKGHNPSFTRQDRSQFLQSLEALIQNIKRETKK